MRHFLGLLLIAILLVSHGETGVFPHVELMHAHEAGAPQHSSSAHDDIVELQMESLEVSSTGESTPHPAPHNHVVPGMPDEGLQIASHRSGRSLPRSNEVRRLAGRDAPPLTQPPSA